jgi:peptidoglycan/xylan/chitin deacetylase (PgdA/CDA1 family)
LSMERPVVRSAERGPTARVTLHSIAGPPESDLARRIEQALARPEDLRPLIGPFSRPIARLSGEAALLEDAEEGLTSGAATPEAVAVRLRRDGAHLEWGPPQVIPDAGSLFDFQYARGASSVEVMRADPSLLTEMQIGAFFQAYWRRRVVRRAACRVGLPRATGHVSASLTRFAMDAAFWRGVHSVATRREWTRLARSSYVVVYYHRIAGERRAGYEHLDVRPRKFASQVRLLRLLGFRPLSPKELIAFHSDPGATLPGRRYVLTADDGYRDAVAAVRRHGDLRPQVFVCTSAVGLSAWWTDNEPIASWEELEECRAAGVVVASHARGHPKLSGLDRDAIDEELTGSMRDLQARLPGAPPLIAYPHGDHDERVRAAAMAAGYRAAFTTNPGRNGAGTDPFCLRRIGIKDWDGRAALIWKAVTGEFLPWWWERSRQRLRAANENRRRARPPEPTTPAPASPACRSNS